MIIKLTYSYDVITHENIFKTEEVYIQCELNHMYHETDIGFGLFVISYYYEEDSEMNLKKVKSDMINLSMWLHEENIKNQEYKLEKSKEFYKNIFKKEIRLKKIKNLI